MRGVFEIKSQLLIKILISKIVGKYGGRESQYGLLGESIEERGHRP
jgi:hypothetical protein